MDTDQRYLNIILSRLRICRTYRPRFGQGKGVGLSLDQFIVLYGADPFYAWFGLNNPLMYAAHRAAGGITSVYRQIGLGCEQVFRQILIDQFGLLEQQARWSYQVQTASGTLRTLSLDGRLNMTDIADAQKRQTATEWLYECARLAGVDPGIASALKGAVFEVRQGYKSKDSKRQNADIANASTAYSQAYMPVAVVLSAQMDHDITTRYRAQRWIVLHGTLSGSAMISTYSFTRDVLGYDLAGFFQRHSDTIRFEVTSILETLLSANN